MPQFGTAIVRKKKTPAKSDAMRVARIVEVRDGFAYLEGIAAPARATVLLRNLTDPVLVAMVGDAPIIVGQLLPEVVVQPADTVLKGKKVRIEADEEILLVSGACKMQLDGRGRHVTVANEVVSRARGANKVQGGSVQLN